MILFFLGFTFINFLSLVFNAFLFYVIYKQPDKTRQPTIYIYNVIIANSLDSITIFFTFLFPFLLEDNFYSDYRRILGPTLTFLCTFSYEHTFYLSLIMVIHRIHVVKEPLTKFYTNLKIWLFCGGFAILSFIFLVIPYFSSCPVNINQRTFNFAVDCANRHPITQLQNDWLILIPVLTFILNICLFLYLAQKRGEALRRRRLNGKMRTSGLSDTQTFSVVSISSTSNVHQLPPLVTRSKSRQSYEHSLLLQSIFTTSFILVYELTGLLMRIFRVRTLFELRTSRYSKTLISERL
ncbi:CRE-SRXA-15 protein [Caenorhabditis remanei]|uniref:CRE-SRXA-15 protein n=1 Tax=Caenorhabditis remanei TaxID=31234 RepID=E3MF16_CAERE|nr:CRE-SRXA-15 protein [Caenorhabditis remanei]